MKEVTVNSEDTEWDIPSATVSQLAELVRETSGIDINACYQCRKCVSGCPVAYAMDYTPVQLLHAVRLGLRGLVLDSAAIWLCASCETCVTRCPQDVDLVKVMDSLRAMALRAGIKPRFTEVAYFYHGHGVAAFYRSSLENIRLFGRMYELGLINQWKLATGQLLKDLMLGVKMLRKGKLKLLPDLASFGRARKIFSRVQKLERR